MEYLFLFLFIFLPINVFAVETSAISSILIEADTNTILLEDNIYEELPMASMTKMMTMLILMERIENGSIALDDKVTISDKSANMGGSQVYLSAGNSYTVETLLKSIAVASANDSSVAIAEYIAGSTDEFVNLMNEKVKELKLEHTSFKNVHGLDEEGHFSCAYDMAIIASELIKHESILKYSSIYEDYIEHPNGTNTWIVNTNKLLNYYEGVDGLKTGYTDKTGYCITVTSKKNDMRLIAVVMGEENNKIRNQDIITLLNYGYSNYKLEHILNTKDNIGDINIKLGNKESVRLKLLNNVSDLVNINENNNYSYEIIKYDIKSPVKVGDIVGKLYLYANETKIEEYDLTIEEDIISANIFELYIRNLKKLLIGTI